MALRIEPTPEFVIPAIEKIYNSKTASSGVRQVAIKYLIAAKHPNGLLEIETQLVDILRIFEKLDANSADLLYFNDEIYEARWTAENLLLQHIMAKMLEV